MGFDFGKIGKKTKIITAIIQLVVCGLCVFVFFNNTLADLVGQKILEILSVKEESDAGVLYGKILSGCLAITLPIIFFHFKFLSDKEKSLAPYFLLQIGLIIAFFSLTKDIYNAIPILENTKTESQGGIVIFGGLVDFFNNLVGKYLWYSFPVLVPLIVLIGNIIFMNLAMKKNDESPFISCFVIGQIVSIIASVAIPIIILWGAKIAGGLIIVGVGILFLLLILTLVGKKKTKITGTVNGERVEMWVDD